MHSLYTTAVNEINESLYFLHIINYFILYCITHRRTLRTSLLARRSTGRRVRTVESAPPCTVYVSVPGSGSTVSA